MLVERESMAETAGAEEDGGVEVFIGRGATTDCLAGVKEEGNVDILDGTFLLEPLGDIRKGKVREGLEANDLPEARE
jgi:hypothetical protein